MIHSYKQESKNEVRHKVIRTAVEALTANRSDSCCVRRSYVRDLYDYFNDLAESKEKQETSKIDISYIQEWENMHFNNISSKRPEELTVCYLSGPEPENDFKELISMGVKPQNIWAFESSRNTYLEALTSFDNTNFWQPKIIKTSIESFFEWSPTIFDIVYVDACASLISDQHALKCIAALFRFHRLNSPGVLISNFASFDNTNSIDKKQYIDAIASYNCIKSKNTMLMNNNGNYDFNSDFYTEKQETEENLESKYGEFISAMICNTASIAVPVKRFCNSNYLHSLTDSSIEQIGDISIESVNTIKNNTLYKFLLMNKFSEQNQLNFEGIVKINKMVNDISVQQNGYSLISSLKKLYDLKLGVGVSSGLKKTLDFFSNGNSMYQFLDKPDSTLFFDSVINQLSYPMHYVADKSLRLTYIAKQKRMYTDLFVFDECRYIYDWLPAIHQIPNAFSNLSWQYTYRFALDGLIKQRLNYNNEFFFRGSVISKAIDGFEAKTMPERIKVN